MRIFAFLVLTTLIISCKQTSDRNSKNIQTEDVVSKPKVYPENISKIFNAHGGLATWKAMQSLEFTIPKEDGNEITTVNLKNRKSLISMANHTIGYDGDNVWLHSKDTMTYKGNPKFYYNLIFYFYAMPFVLADEGINYENTDPLVIEGKTYPGIKISYNTGIGESSDDEYILYYDAETNRMTWLGYTVTYFSKEKGKEFHFIKYGNWQTIEGLLLPETLTWYNYENNMPTTKRCDRTFTNVVISKENPNKTLFEIPEGAKIIE